MTPPTEEPSAAKLKHLDYIQAAITRMSGYSFLFKGWAITLITGLATLAALDRRRGVLAIGLVATALFWALDAYYLWLERGFVALHNKVASGLNNQVDFSMVVDKQHATVRWLRACISKRLLLFYGAVTLVDVIEILLVRGRR